MYPILIAIILLILLTPRWGYNRTWTTQPWGYYPVGGAGFLLVILIVLLLIGRL